MSSDELRAKINDIIYLGTTARRTESLVLTNRILALLPPPATAKLPEGPRLKDHRWVPGGANMGGGKEHCADCLALRNGNEPVWCRAAPPVPGESKAATIDHANSNWIDTMSARIAELEAEVNDFHHHLQQLCHAVSEQQFTVNSCGWADVGKPTEYAKGGARRHQYDLIEQRLKAAYDFMEPKPHPKAQPTPAEKPDPLARAVTWGDMLRLADLFEEKSFYKKAIRTVFPQGAAHAE